LLLTVTRNFFPLESLSQRSSRFYFKERYEIISTNLSAFRRKMKLRTARMGPAADYEEEKASSE